MNRCSNQPSRTAATTYMHTPDDLAASAIPLEALAAVTGGSDDDRLMAHELVHVIQQRGR
jgi:hypothetical protein